MSQNGATLFVVDNDRTALVNLTSIVSLLGVSYRFFSSAQQFLDYYNPSLFGCILAEMRLKDMSALELQEQLSAMGGVLPIILTSSEVDVSAIVCGIKNGASTFVQKPFKNDELAKAVKAALKVGEVQKESHTMSADVRHSFEMLSPREKQLLEFVVTGVPNKRIAYIFGTSHRTVDRIRATVFRKMRVQSAVELANVVAKIPSRNFSVSSS
jgi:two-component system, LuxR family, response regulator FixJ